MATKYSGMQIGHWAPMPNHQMLQLNELGIEDCATLYQYCYDAVIRAEDETTIHTYCCDEHGTFISDEKAETMPCTHMIDDEHGGSCDLPSDWKSTRVSGDVYYGKAISLKDIALHTRLKYGTVVRRATQLVDAVSLGGRGTITPTSTAGG
jgi:hypothetical protein